MTDEFEKAFSDFLDRREYDQASNALHDMVRIAFRAGWLAAGGSALPAQPVVQIERRGEGEVVVLYGGDNNDS